MQRLHYGKYKKAPFPARDSSSIGILDLIYFDVSGRMSHVSLRGFEYYVIFIDDFSKKTYFFLNTKGEVFKCFKKFNALVQNQIGKKIKVLRSDNGGEYIDSKFVDFCASEGIRREFTVPYTPQQNGVVERKNGAIIGATRAMLHD